MAVTLQGMVLIDGEASGTVLKLAAPISFWGGVDPNTGRITQPAHPNFKDSISGKVLVLPGMIGSSSSSAVMLELIGNGKAPVALIMASIDAILALGVVAAGELDLPDLPVVQCAVDQFVTGQSADISAGGAIRLGDGR